MGNYTLVIVATGEHHNGRPDDADAMGNKLVADLQAAGHVVHHAILTHGTHEHLATNDEAADKG